MSDRDLKCVHCYEDQSDYGNQIDAGFVFDGLSLCAEHYHQHRDLVISDTPEAPRIRMYHESYLGPEINNPSIPMTISIPYRDGYAPPQ